MSTWLYQIATNAAIDRMRSRSFKENAETSNVDKEMDLQNMHGEKRPRSAEEQVIHQEMNECIQGYLSVLPENYRAVVILSEMEEMKNIEIAAILGLSVGAVKIRLHRAKGKLKELLLKNCNFYQSECCGRLACEPKGPFPKNIKPLTINKER